MISVSVEGREGTALSRAMVQATAFVRTIEPTCLAAMPEESADILSQDLIWVNAFDRRCKSICEAVSITGERYPGRVHVMFPIDSVEFFIEHPARPEAMPDEGQHLG